MGRSIDNRNNRVRRCLPRIGGGDRLMGEIAMVVQAPSKYRKANIIRPYRRVPVIPGYTVANRPQPEMPAKQYVSDADKTLMFATVAISLLLVIVPGVLPLFI